MRVLSLMGYLTNQFMALRCNLRSSVVQLSHKVVVYVGNVLWSPTKFFVVHLSFMWKKSMSYLLSSIWHLMALERGIKITL